MKYEDTIKFGKSLWKSSDVIVEDARGASKGFHTKWNEHEISMDYRLKTHHLDTCKIQTQVEQQILCNHQCIYVD
jgi:hypothetical protein